jgi:hypothetical protein
MLEQMSPQQRQELEKIARELAKDMPESADNQQPRGGGREPSPQDAGGRDESEQRAADGPEGDEPGGGRQGSDPRQDRPREGERSQQDRQGARGAGGGSQGATGPRIGSRSQVDDGATPSNPQATVPVDARGGRAAREASQRTIGDLMPDPNARRAAPATARGGDAAQGFREAAAGAERSIENQSVPSQHADLVRRVFERYQKRVNAKQGTQQAPAQQPQQPAPDAPDARPK